MRVFLPNHSYRFGRFEVQAEERRLLANGAPLLIGPRAFDVLLLLLERAGSLVEKKELLSRAWPGVVVEENALQGQISVLRRLIGRESIATVSRSGYRFIPEVKADTSKEAGTPKHNLTKPLTSFIGRETQLRELRQALERSRLVTLTGAGGCGKTRLIVQLAAGILGDYRDGCWFVDLSALTEPESVLHAVANVLSIRVEPNQSLPEAISDHLSTRSSLLILDNVEHLLKACADLAGHLLRTCPRAVVVATGREPLRLEGECVYRVPSLTLPKAGHDPDPAVLLESEAARLFVDRARLHASDFAISTRNAAALASICRRLDGIPLALELAAARMRMMTVQELDHRLIKRFPVLAARQRDAMPRHMTLRSLIDWSYDLLAPAERALLCRASIFAGGFDLEAAEEVCSDDEIDKAQVLTLVESLVDKNLVHAEDRNGVTRFGLRETVRQYASERASEQPGTAPSHQRHLEHFVRRAQISEQGLTGPEQSEAFDRLELDHDNFRAVLSLCCDRADLAEAGLTIVASIWKFWSVRGYLIEGGHWCSRLLALPLTVEHCDVHVEALNGYAALLYHRGDGRAAKVVWEKALQISRARGDARNVARGLGNLGAFAHSEGLDDEAKALYLESLHLSRKADSKRSIATNLINLAMLAMKHRDYSRQCEDYLLEGRRQFEAIGDQHSAMAACSAYSHWMAHHDLKRALTLCLEALSSFLDLNDPWSTALAFDRIGFIALRCRMPHYGGIMIGASDGMVAAIGAQRPDPLVVDDVALLGSTDDPRRSAFEAARKVGQTMSLDGALALARSDELKGLVAEFAASAASAGA